MSASLLLFRIKNIFHKVWIIKENKFSSFHFFTTELFTQTLHKHTHHFISCNFRFDGKQFCEDLQKACESRKKRGKTPWKF